MVYGWGNYPPWEVYRRGYTRRFAKIITSEEGPRLELSIRNGKYSFQLSKDRKTLYGRYTNAIELKKTGASVPLTRTSSLLPPQAKTVAFVNVNVIPMDKERVMPSQTVIVEDGRIAQIGPMDQVTIPKSAEIIRGEGKAFLMPGLADMHVHIDLFLIADGNDLKLLIANGVTTVRNMWGWDRHLLLREEVKEGRRVGPAIYSAGPMLDGSPPIHPTSRVIETVEEVRQVVKKTKVSP